MSSSLIKSSRMKGLESKKPHSWWNFQIKCNRIKGSESSRKPRSWRWDSHITPNNFKWLQDNHEEMDQNVKKMLKLVEEKKTELYLKRRPELISLVKELHRIYLSLAERYENVTGELFKNKSGPLAVGFNCFLGSDTDGNSKEGDGELSSTLNSNEIYKEELRIARDNTQKLGEEIARVTLELQHYKTKTTNNSMICGGEMKQNQFKEIQESDLTMEEELSITLEKLFESEEKHTKKDAIVQSLQDQLESARKEIPIWRNKLDKWKKKVSILLNRTKRYKNKLSERDKEIQAMKKAISNKNKSLLEENDTLKAKITRMTKMQGLLEDNLKELDIRCESFEEDARRAKAAKIEAEIAFESQTELLKADISERDDQIEELKEKLDELKMNHEVLVARKDDRISQMGVRLHQLHFQRVELLTEVELAHRSADELGLRVEELEREVESKREAIREGDEGKREAIRQLCFAIEHYRDKYDELRRRVAMVHNRPGAMVA